MEKKSSDDKILEQLQSLIGGIPLVKSEPAKKPDVKKTYHVVKRKEDNMWEVKLAKVGDAQGKAIKLLKTKPEAEEYVKKMAENQGASIAVHASKGKSKGRIQ